MPSRLRTVAAFVLRQKVGWRITIEVPAAGSDRTSTLGPFVATDTNDARTIIAAVLGRRGLGPREYAINWESSYEPA